MIAILGMFKIVPSWCWWLLALAGLCLGCELHGRHAGEAVVQAKWDAVKREQATYVAKVAEKQDVVLRQTITQYVDRERVVHDQGAVIIKKVPVYVTAQNDAQCTINNGFVRLWNAANAGVQLPDAAGAIDGQASGVVLSDVEKQHIAESTYARSLEVQIESWQDWAAGQQKAAAPP